MPSPSCDKKKQKHIPKKTNFSPAICLHISMLNDIWMLTEAIETHICKLSMDLRKLKLEKLCQKNNTFMVSVHLVLDALGEVAKHLKD